MSFVKKAIKKVFKVVKKVVKKVVSVGKKLWSNKWFRIAVIIGLSVFTMGVATVGFGAFAAGGGISGFFAAVGSTMSIGMGTITGGLLGTTTLGGAGAAAGGGGLLAAEGSIIGTAGTGIGISTGVTNAAAAGGGVFSAGVQAAALTGGQIAASGITAAGVATSATALVPGIAVNAATNTATKGLVARMLSPLTANTVNGSLLRTGIIMGVQGYMRGKEMEQEAFYRDNKTVFGGPAFGGTDEPVELLAPFIDRAPPSPTAPAGQQQPDPFVTPEAALTQQGAPQGLLTPQQKQGFADAQQAGAAAGPTATDLLAQQQSAQPPPTQQGGPAPFPGNIRPELLGVA